MPADKKKTRTLFRMEDKGPMADRKGTLYKGFVGGYDLGTVVAPNKTAAKKKLLAIARKALK